MNSFKPRNTIRVRALLDPGETGVTRWGRGWHIDIVHSRGTIMPDKARRSRRINREHAGFFNPGYIRGHGKCEPSLGQGHIVIGAIPFVLHHELLSDNK